MFTGIIEAIGKVIAIDQADLDIRMRIEAGRLDLSEIRIGDSISVNGVCLTVVRSSDTSFSVDISRETLACTTLGDLAPGSALNLERALTLASHLGGHLVTGHVDGVGTIVSRQEQGQSLQLTMQAPEALARYISRKGAICIDGVSLTINAVEGARFDVQLIPHTLKETIAASYQPGDRVNIEVDLLARYIERLLETSSYIQPSTASH
jgi:riboflavin synthase